MCLSLKLSQDKGYQNAGVDSLKLRKTDEIWVSMKVVHDDLGVKICLI